MIVVQSSIVVMIGHQFDRSSLCVEIINFSNANHCYLLSKRLK